MEPEVYAVHDPTCHLMLLATTGYAVIVLNSDGQMFEEQLGPNDKHHPRHMQHASLTPLIPGYESTHLWSPELRRKQCTN